MHTTCNFVILVVVIIPEQNKNKSNLIQYRIDDCCKGSTSHTCNEIAQEGFFNTATRSIQLYKDKL